MKKLLTLLLFLLLSFSVYSCSEETSSTTTTTSTTTFLPIEINVDTNGLSITEGDTYQLVVTSNDSLGLTYEVSETGIINLSDTGFIEALSEGSVVVTITSKTDETVYEEIDVIVRKAVTLTTQKYEIELTEEDLHQLVISSNDTYTFESLNPDILTVSETGLVTAKEEGTTSVIVTSTYDTEVSITIVFTIKKLVTIDVDKDSYVMVIGDKETINAVSNDGLTYLSGDQNIVTVSTTGEIEAVGFGTTDIFVVSTYDELIFEKLTVTVYKYTEEIVITGNPLLIKGMESNYEIEASPVGSFEAVYWESSDSSVITVTENGVVTAIGQGLATITAKSVLDETIADTFNIEVVNILVVDESKTTGNTYTYQSLELTFGEQLFASITDALAQAEDNTIIYVESGNYQENINIENAGIVLEAISEASYLDGIIDVKANEVLIKGFNFSGASKIVNSVAIEGLTIENNKAIDLTTSTAFIDLLNATNTKVIGNSFVNIQATVVSLVDFKGDLTLIKDNNFNNVTKAIKIDVESQLANTDEIKIYWNTISDVDLAFDIDMLFESTEQEVFKAARFNKVSLYTQAVKVNEGSTFDFTFNYWGSEEIDYLKFDNVDHKYLVGTYQTEAEVLTETLYNPTLPIIIIVDNPIDEIMIGETHTFEYTILPYELSDAPVKFITGNPEVVIVNQQGAITPLISGEAYIQVRSAIVSSIRTQVNFSVITTPGIEITSTHLENDVIVGDSFTLGAILFPYTVEGEDYVIESDAPTVASVDNTGLVTAHAEGLVTFTASLVSDSTVSVDYTIYVHGALSPETNLLDYLTTKQISYSTIHDWVAYGFQYNYYDKRAESVSRYYFGDVEINTSMIVPVFYGIRPGEPMDPLPEGVTQYNPYNVHWIVVHDTASTALGSNALAHANYLYNNTVLENALWTSWHFSIDDHNVYQHLPEIERGFHAGDGSVLPGQSSTYLGGGNRNGIGIEMCVNEDGDMYRTWQRTAKLVSYLLEKYSLPLDHQTYHNDFSGKDCPRTLRNAGLVPLFEEFVATEYYIRTNYPNAEITFTSNNPDYLDNTGRIIQLPQRAMTVSYTITVTDSGVTESRTFYTYLPGTVR